MTAQAADRVLKTMAGGDVRSVNASSAQAAATAVLFHGSMCQRGGTGGAFIAVATATGNPVIAWNNGAKVDNSAGADGAKDCPDLMAGRLVVKHAGTFTDASIGQMSYVVDDQTVAPTGAVPAGPVMEYLSATEVAIWIDPGLAALAAFLGAQADNQTLPYGVQVFTFKVPDAATSDIDITVGRKVEVIDVLAQKQNGAGAGNTMQVKNAANAISNAIACDTDNALTRAASIDDAQSTILAGGTLRLTATRAAGTRNALITIHVIPRV